MARIDAAYNYFLSTYGKDLGTKYESHKKSELRDTYNSILKINKDSPLYKITQTGDVAKFAIDIKESANEMHRQVMSLGGDGEDASSLLRTRVASSSDEKIVDAKYVGNNPDQEGFTVQVDKLAKPQINTGSFLSPMGRSFEAGSYSFDLDTHAGSYEFQFNVNEGDTNLEVQQRVARLINSSDVGINAEVLTNEKNQTALSLTSRQTGLAEGEEFLFNISSSTSWRELMTLGIGNITQPASNSHFFLNGKERSSLSNTFTINKSFELTLKGESSDPVSIGFKADAEAVADGLERLINSYNGMVAVGSKYSEAHSNNRLLNDVTAIAKSMSSILEAIGVTADSNGMLKLDRGKLTDKLSKDDEKEGFKTINKFKDALKRQSKRASLNPMSYVNKVIVEYKNPGHTLNHPYAPSAYAGMLVDTAL